MIRARLLPELAPTERVRFACAALAFMCVASAALIARATADALFLSHFSPIWLPYMYIGSAVLLIIVSYSYAGFATWVPAGRLIAVAASLLVLTVFAVRALFLFTSAPWTRIVSYFLADILVNLPMVLFFSFLGLIFDLREGKRLFGLVGSAGTVGCIASGLAVRPLARGWGTENLLFLVAILLSGFVAIVIFLTRREARRLSAKPQRMATGPVGDKLGYYTELLKTRQLRNLAAFTFIMTFALIAVDYQFKTAARAHFSGPMLAGFFGNFYAFSNVAALVLQLFLVHRILQHAGLFVALLVLPMSVLLGSAFSAVSGAFAWTVATKASEPVFNFSVNSAAVQMLYLGIKKRSRGQARAFVDGVCKPLAMAIAGLLLVAGATRAIELTRLAQLVSLVAGLWLISCWRNYRAYMAGLVDSVGARTADFQSAVRVSDRALEGHVRRSLLSASDDEVPYVAGLLEEFSGLDATGEFRQLLRRESPQVKVLALEYLGQNPDRQDLEASIAHLDHPNPAVRIAAIGTAAACGADDAVPAMEARLQDPVASVRAAAAAQLINVGDLDAFLDAGTALKAMLGSDDGDDRASATQALSKVRTGGATRLLRTLLADTDPRVRLAALQAFRARPNLALLEDVISLLGDPAVASAAEDCLAQLGESVLDAVNLRLSDVLARAEYDSVGGIARLAARIGSERGVPIVVAALAHTRAELRAEVIGCLARLVESQPSVRPYVAVLEEILSRELADARRWQEWKRHFADKPGTEVLRWAIQDEFTYHLRNVFILLDALIPNVEIKAVLATFESREGESRAQVLELLDNVLPANWKPKVMALMEQRPESVVADVGDFAEFYADDAEEWIILGALHGATSGAFEISDARVAALFENPSEAVREAVLHLLSARRSSTLHVLLERAAEDPSSHVRAMASRLFAHRDTKESDTMITVQKALFLRSIPLFAGMSSKEIGHVASMAEDIVYAAGTPILREGDPGDSLYVIVDGTVRVHRGDTTFSTLKQNDFLGEMSLFDGEPRSASATAATDCVVLRLGQAEFHEILARHFGAVLSVLKSLTQRVRKKEQEAATAQRELERVTVEAPGTGKSRG